MTYKVNIAALDKIISPVTAMFDGKSKNFSSGIEMSEFDFEKNYLIDRIYIKEEKIMIELKENDRLNNINWVGEEQVSFF